MIGSGIFYAGVAVFLAGVLTMFRRRRRIRGFTMAVAGLGITFLAMVLPVRDHHATAPVTRLDELMPLWQFEEKHSIRIDAPPERVFEALRSVSASDILFFRLLTTIRRLGRPAPESILNAPENEPILDVATRSGFIWLANEPPRELVLGTVITAPAGTQGTLVPEVFKEKLSPGFALAAMNFVVRPDGAGSIVTTETRVYANNPQSRRAFARYWRVIYPGSAVIRRMWLRAVAKKVGL